MFSTRVADRVLVFRPAVRPEFLRWESRIQDIGPPETSQPHVISIGKSSPKDVHLNPKTQLHSTTRELQCWTPHAKQTTEPTLPTGGRHQKQRERASLVAQWLRICLLMQGTRVRALAWEDPTCRGAAGPVSHNC